MLDAQVLSSIISANQRWEDLRLNLPEVVLVVVSEYTCLAWCTVKLFIVQWYSVRLCHTARFSDW
jgi:hypothetical protein